MECDVCLIEWDPIIHIPRLLACGHTLCESCLISILKMAKSKNTDFFCPNCMNKQKEIKEEKDIKLLVKNINLLRIVEKIETRKSIMQQSFCGGANNTKLDQSSQLLSNRSILAKQVENEYKTILNTNEITCKKHGLIIHSFASGSNQQFCSVCLKDASIKTLPLPTYIKEFKRKLDSSQMKLSLIKQEIEKLQIFFTSYQDEFEKTNNEKIDELFNYLNKIIQFNYNTAKTVVSQCKKEQDIQIETKMKEMLELLKEVADMEYILASIAKVEESEYINYNDRLNEVFQKVCYFLNYELELNLFQMHIGLKEDAKSKLFEIIQNSYQVDVDFVTVNDEPATIKHILQKDKLWFCICGESDNPVGQYKCHLCGCFRKMESLENLIVNPFDSTKSEMQFLHQRRKQEIKEFQALYKKNEKTEFYFVLDIEWFLLWKCFVTNDLTEKYIPNVKKRISVNKNIGILPPGPITNAILIDRKTNNIRKGLKKNDDFIIVNQELWFFFFNNYNGGPEIRLNGNTDIYANLNGVRDSAYSYDELRRKNSRQSLNFEEGLFNQDNIQIENNIDNEEKKEEQKENKEQKENNNSNINLSNNNSSYEQLKSKPRNSVNFIKEGKRVY
jgi:hypothetical protein